MGLLENLGIGWQEILYYTIALIVLVGGLWLLLYRPVKKMVKEHREKIACVFEDNERLKKEAEEAKREFSQKQRELEQQSVKTTQAVINRAAQKSEEILSEAHAAAKSILESAQKEAASEKDRLKNEYRDSVGTLAVEIAQKLLEREITDKDNSLLIDQALSDWEGDDD